MTDHILYSFRRCPYAIRARMAMAYAGIACELRELLLRDKPADMLKHSPKGTVPVLITATGQVIDESLEVMLWALQQHDPQDWLATLDNSLPLIHSHDTDFKPLLDRYKYADRHPQLTATEHQQMTLPFIAALDQRLSGHSYLVNEQVSVADVALFPFIRQYAMVDKNWFDQLPYPYLQRWLDAWLNSELFAAVMPKCALFNEGFRYHFPDYQPLD